MAGFYENGNGPSFSIKCWEFFELGAINFSRRTVLRKVN